MKEEILKLVSALGEAGADSGVLDALCAAACQKLDGMLADGVTARDCADAYVPAAAWLVLDWLQASKGLDGITALSAGDMTVRREGGSREHSLEQRAMELMAPWRKDKNFVFQGVRG